MLIYVVSLLLFGGIYALLALGLNLQWGHTGLVNLGFVAFFAIGAYAAGLLSVNDVPFVLGLSVAIGAAGLAAWPLGRIALRLQDDYLAIVTFGFAEVLRAILKNAEWSGGANGLAGIPQLFGPAPADLRPYLQLVFVAGAVALVLVLLWRLTESPYGRALRAIRDDPVAAGSLGKATEQYRLAALVLGSAIAGLAGAIYAHYIGFISPDQFDPALTFLIFTGVVVGGSNYAGAAVGTTLLIAVMESTRFLGDLGVPISEADFAQIRLILVGLALIVFMQRRRQGLWPYRHRQRFLRSAEAEAEATDA